MRPETCWAAPRPGSLSQSLCTKGEVRFTCHAQSLAATNRVTEQFNWLTVESFFMSYSISWIANLIDNLYLLDLIVLVSN